MVTVFCDIDDFCQRLQAIPPLLLPSHEGEKKSSRCVSLALSEIMTLLVFFHASRYRTFKHFYQDQMLGRGRADFPGLPRDNRFVELSPLTLLPLCAYVQTRQGQPDRSSVY